MPKESRFISDPAELGMARVREVQAVSMTDSHRLTDVDGVGPSTAEKLEDAGIDRPAELARVTPNQLEAVDGIGPKKADALSRRFQYGRTRFDSPNDDHVEDVQEDMAERSRAARRTDRSFNAPITLDEDKWQEAPDRYDYPGVDTIPQQRRANRATKKAQRGGFKIDSEQLPGRQQGRATGDRAQVDVGSSFDPASTAAHEIGHLAEISMAGRGGVSSELFEDQQVKQEAEELAVRRRSMVTSAESIEDAYYEDDYEQELFADAFAVATEEPRAAKREAPNLFRELQDETLMDFGRF